MIRNVIRAVALFRTNETKVISNEQDLDKALEEYNYRHSKAYLAQEWRQNCFNEPFKEERYFYLIGNGSPEDIHEIDNILNKDRQSYLFHQGILRVL